MDDNTERNAKVQARYDAMMADGKHGHYETMFKLVHEQVDAERERCAALVQAAREGEADTDFRSILSRIRSGARHEPDADQN